MKSVILNGLAQDDTFEDNSIVFPYFTEARSIYLSISIDWYELKYLSLIVW